MTENDSEREVSVETGEADPLQEGPATSELDPVEEADPPISEPEAEPAADDDEGTPEQDAELEVEVELAAQLDELQSEFETLNERHLRLAAEFQNYRRRADLEMGEAWSRAQADLVRRFLEVLDDLQRVSRLDPSDEAVSVEAIVEGVDLVERKFARALEDAGVEVVDPVGEPFDPERMEAVMRVVATSPEDDDLVDQVFQRGYLLKGHLIRPARVSVIKHE